GIVTQFVSSVYGFSSTGVPLSGFGFLELTKRRQAILRNSRDKKSVLLFRCFCLGRFAGAIQNVRVNESNLRGRDVPREGRHAEFVARTTQHDFLEHFMRRLRSVSQVRNRSSADCLPAVAPRTGIGEKLASLFNFGLGSRKFESGHRNGTVHMRLR